MEFLNRCNGYTIGGIRFSQQSIDLIKQLHAELMPQFYQEYRKQFADSHGSDYERGGRFTCPVSIYLRIASACTEEEFKTDPKAWVWDALRNCAGADYWYAYEKDWGQP